MTFRPAFLRLCVGFLSFAGTLAAAPIPIADLVRQPQISRVRISPDGRHAAAVVSNEGFNGLLLVNLATGEMSGQRGKRTYNPYGVRWLDDEHLLFYASTRDRGGSKIFLAPIDRLNDPKEVIHRGGILSLPRARPGTLLLQHGFWHADDPIGESYQRRFAPFEMNLSPLVASSGKVTQITNYPALPKGELVTYHDSAFGELALGVTNVDGVYRLHRLSTDGKEWTTLPLDLTRSRVMGVEGDVSRIWLAVDEPGAGFQLRLYHANTGVMDEPIYTDPNYDFAEGYAIFSEKDGTLAGLHYNQRRGKTVWFNPDFANLQAGIDQSRPDTDNVLVAQDRTGTKFAFVSRSDRQPGEYFVADLATKKITPLGQRAPWLDPAKLLPTRPFGCKTRDGASLEGYLTLPAGASKTKPVPLVVLVHDGPRERDTWDYDRNTQFLASRGYAVVRVNYRGSAGYPIADRVTWDFPQISDDVADATRALLKTGLFRADRVAVMGEGAGGYSALHTAAREPGLFAAAISVMGICDWSELIKTYRNFHYDRFGGYERLATFIGTPGKDREKLSALSLFSQTAQLTMPVYIAHGTEPVNGTYPGVRQAERLAKELRGASRDVTTFFREFSSDDLYEHDELVNYYRTLEKFLATHLQP